ncbi:N-acetylglucosaminidase, partial [Legionella shakespearei]
DATLKKIDHQSGILATEAKALATGGAESAATGTHFHATDIIANNLGSAIGSAIVDIGRENSPLMPEEEELKSTDEFFLTENVFDMIHPEQTEDEVYLSYLAQNLKQKGSETFAKNHYWNEKSHGVEQFLNDKESLDAMGLSLNANRERITYQKSPLTFEEALNRQARLKGSSSSKYEMRINGRQRWVEASRDQIREHMNIEKLLADPVQKFQFLDLRYEAEFEVDTLDDFLKNKGVLAGKGAYFLAAAKENNVNPIYLIAHALHESGNGKSELAVDDHNYFGAGAHDNKAKEKGAEFADKNGWKTIELGIIGGAKVISKGWINNSSGSQRTLYSMRWNPEHPATQQYATNVSWASAQTEKIHKGMTEFMKMNPTYQP